MNETFPMFHPMPYREETVTFTIPNQEPEENPEEIKRQHRQKSIVRNPCLPQRFKKGSKWF